MNKKHKSPEKQEKKSRHKRHQMWYSRKKIALLQAYKANGGRQLYKAAWDTENGWNLWRRVGQENMEHKLVKKST